MVDPITLTRRWLLNTAAVTDLLGTNLAGSVYGGGTVPEHFDPALGPCVVISVVGGAGHPEITAISKPRLQVRCWAGVNQSPLARQLYRAVYDAMAGATNLDFGAYGRVITCQEAVCGQDVTDADTAWATVLAFFDAQIASGTSGSVTDLINAQGETVKEYVDAAVANQVEDGGSI